MIAPAEEPQTTRKRPTIEQRRIARRDYVQGKGTKEAIAQRYGLSYDTVKNWSRAENWGELRAAFDQSQLDALKPATPQPPPALQPQPQGNPLAARVQRIEEQMEEIEREMKGANAQAKRDLTAAHSRLFDVYCTLTGIQKPGTARRSKAGTGRPQAQTPIEAPVESPGPQAPVN